KRTQAHQIANAKKIGVMALIVPRRAHNCQNKTNGRPARRIVKIKISGTPPVRITPKYTSCESHECAIHSIGGVLQSHKVCCGAAACCQIQRPTAACAQKSSEPVSGRHVATAINKSNNGKYKRGRS